VEFINSAFLFVHGFNVTFENALYRAAQLAFDMNFDGPAFMYSWPAVGKTLDYGTDMGSAEHSAKYLDDYIDLILQTPGVERLHVVVHSMGNAALAKLVQMRDTKLESRGGKTIDQLILAVPDIDVDAFNQVSEYFTECANGVTLYACRTDKALLASKKLRGGHARAGDVPRDGPVVVPNVDTIDVSAVGTAWFSLNHSVYAENRGLLDDVGILMMHGIRPPSGRMPTLTTIDTSKGRYWVMPK
jgi:esterase/lipase superfamily enzyme